MSIKNQAISIGAKLSKIAKMKGVSYQIISTSFLIERLLVRILRDKSLVNNLVFKGGYVGLRVYNSERYTVDLDALLLNADVKTTLEKTTKAIQSDIGDGTWFELETQIDLKTQGVYGGVRQLYRGGIGERPIDIRKSQIIHFDLGIGDPITPSPVLIQTAELIGGDEISWYIYPMETITAEKLETLIVRGGDNSRAKDVFDLYFYLPMADHEQLKIAIIKCFEFRKTEFPKDPVKFLNDIDTSLLKKGWMSAVASLKGAPNFETAFKFILIELEKIYPRERDRR
jgi:predicted nucleotidyltransferase component of viral defense system